MYRVLRIIWLAAHPILLTACAWLCAKAYRPAEIADLFLGIFAIMSFPSSLLVDKMFFFVSQQFPGMASIMVFRYAEVVSFLLVWGLLFLAGYVQWFVVIPLICGSRKIHVGKSSRSPRS